MVELKTIPRDWKRPVVVAATGPSLTAEVAMKVRLARWLRGWKVVAVNDAYRLIPHADVLYACDERWWKAHEGALEATGERWSTHEVRSSANDKSMMPPWWNVNLVAGKAGMTFSTNPAVIHYGSNSGFQAVNFALLRGATRVVLVGFDMRRVNGRGHFFGDHPAPMHNRADYKDFLLPFRKAAEHCHVRIENATPGSLLDAFPMVELDDALAEDATGVYDLLHSDRPEPDAGTDRVGAA